MSTRDPTGPEGTAGETGVKPLKREAVRGLEDQTGGLQGSVGTVYASGKGLPNYLCRHEPLVLPGRVRSVYRRRDVLPPLTRSGDGESGVAPSWVEKGAPTDEGFTHTTPARQP